VDSTPKEKKGPGRPRIHPKKVSDRFTAHLSVEV